MHKKQLNDGDFIHAKNKHHLLNGQAENMWETKPAARPVAPKYHDFRNIKLTEAELRACEMATD